MFIPNEVMNAVKKSAEEQKMKELEAAMTKAVACKQAVATYVEGLDHDTARVISRNSETIKIWTVLNAKGEPSGYFVIFNIAEIEGRENLGSIQIDVPEGKGGLVAGPGRCNIKDMLHFPLLWKRNIRWIDLCVEGE